MLRVNTTVVAVIAPSAIDALTGAHASNVRVVRPDADAAPLDRAVAAWEQARHTSKPYLLHDADPLHSVATAWVQRFDGVGVVGDLEVAVTATLARWRARSIDLPDYYLVVDAEDLAPTLRHWYLGVLGGASPMRVVTGRSSAPVVDQLGGLRSGPWWPDLDRVLADVDSIAPEQAGGLATSLSEARLIT